MLVVLSSCLLQAPSPQSPLPSESTPVATSLRLVSHFSSGFEFALALRLSNLSDPTRVLSFLLLPIHQSFDPSLAFLAAGALPVSMILYHFCRGPEKPRLGGVWAVPKGGQIDSKMIIGASLFGVGWGIAGICRTCPSPSHHKFC